MSVFKLDLFEFYYLDKKARFAKTKTLLSQKKKHLEENINNAVKYNKSFLIPLGLQPEVSEAEINSLKKEIFEHKVHNGIVQFKRVLKKTANANKKKSDKESEFLSNLDVEKLSKSRVVKIVSKIFNLKDLEKNSFIQEQWVIDGALDKENEINPSFLHSSLSAEEKNYLSKILNNKELKKVNDSVELSFKLILGPVLDKKSNVELKKIEKETGIEGEKREVDSEEEEDSNDDAADSYDDVSEDGEEQLGEFDEDALSKFDGLIGDSEEEDEEVALDTNIDYNQVTDEEPSDYDDDEEDEEEVEEKDDFFVEDLPTKKEKKEKEKKSKHKLPELVGGYYSGGEGESDFEQDKLVEEIIKPERKNRRGQRARQKIWEQKYGRGANHVKKEGEERQKQREQKQLEWEEREKKRQEKAIKNGEVASGGNSTPLGAKNAAATTAMHPSWEAKMRQKELLKNVKFEGKKKTFD
jgi:hypothetical protein